jgi:hypothetical protein
MYTRHHHVTITTSPTPRQLPVGVETALVVLDMPGDRGDEASDLEERVKGRKGGRKDI